MAANTSQFGALLEPTLRSAIIMAFDQQPDDYLQIANVLTSRKNVETDRTFSDLGPMSVKNEGTAISFDDPVQGFQTTYTHITYGAGFKVTEELVEDDLYNVINKYPQALGRSASHTINTTVFNTLNNGFSTNLADGVPLFSASHPLVNDPGTGDNRITAADLSPTSLQDLINALELTQSDSGLRTPVHATMLLVPVQEQFNAETILNSAQASGTANNDINAIRMKRLRWMSSPYLTDTDAWFLKGDIHEHNVFIRRPLRIESTNDFDSGSLKVKATVRFSKGVSDWRGWGGSAGA